VPRCIGKVLQTVSTSLPIRQPIKEIVSQDEYILKPYNFQCPAQLGAGQKTICAEIIRRRLDNISEFKMVRHRLMIDSVLKLLPALDTSHIRDGLEKGDMCDKNCEIEHNILRSKSISVLFF
jgi:hypothetical protein